MKGSLKRSSPLSRSVPLTLATRHYRRGFLRCESRVLESLRKLHRMDGLERGNYTIEQVVLYQVSEAGSALRVAVGYGRRNRCAEIVCVERQRLQRLQQPELRRPLRSRGR